MAPSVDLTRCFRCGGQLKDTDTRIRYKGIIYHFYCHYKLTQKEKEDANTLHPQGGRDADISRGGDKGGAGGAKGR